MIKKILPLVALFLSGSAMAQIGIGTKMPSKAAQLDIVANDKGVLLPRVELIAKNNVLPITGPIENGLIVYHTGNSELKEGFYYWTNLAWNRLLTNETFVDRKNISFTLGVNPSNNLESLIVKDSEGEAVYLSVEEIASNSSFTQTLVENKEFITHLVENKEFITQLGDNIDFVTNITSNEEFITNIIQELNDTYGNVGYDFVKKTFYYFDEGGNKIEIAIKDLNTLNFSFTLDNDHLVITDTSGEKISLAVSKIASNGNFTQTLVENKEFITQLVENKEFITHLVENKEFITQLVENKEFITQLGDNIDFVTNITSNEEFITNIIQELNDTYGNVGYDVVKKTFYYFDEDGKKIDIAIESLNTTNLSFTLDDDYLVITDSSGEKISLAVSKIASNGDFIQTLVDNKDFITHLVDNKDFITQLVENKEFITQLGNNIDFVTHITSNEEFITNIIQELNDTYGNVGYDVVKETFYYFDEDGKKIDITIESLNTTNLSFKLNDAHLVITDTAGHSVILAVSEIASNGSFTETLIKNENFITELVQNKEFITQLVENKEFITQLGNNIDFVTHITSNEKFITNIIQELNDTYGNVGYDVVKETFYYFDEDGKKIDIAIDSLNTTNLTFKLNDAHLVITDTAGHSVILAVSEIASNGSFTETLIKNENFITELVQNKEFITQLGDNIDFVNNITSNNKFITNIIEELKDTYGNVGYDSDKEELYYLDSDGKPQPIVWADLNTVTTSFSLSDDHLVIKDSDQGSFKVSVADIASNETFGSTLVNNENFINTLVKDETFINNVTSLVNPVVVVDYTSKETIKAEKWIDGSEIAQRVYTINIQKVPSNIITLDGDFASLILNARLIRSNTSPVDTTTKNSISVGLVHKAIEGNKTILTLGIPGALTYLQPGGEYHLILEYVKKK